MNIGQIFSDVVTIAEDVVVDEQLLAAGTDVPIATEIQVGSVGGKAIYLKGAVLSTTPK